MAISHLTTVDGDRTLPLNVGDHIFKGDRVSIDRGATWCAGLYHDWANYLHYVTDKGIVRGVFPEDRTTWDQSPYRAALALYTSLQKKYERKPGP